MLERCLFQEEVSAILGNDEFSLVANRLEFEPAARDCLNRGAILAGIVNEEENKFVANLSSQLEFENEIELWIGINNSIPHRLEFRLSYFRAPGHFRD